MMTIWTAASLLVYVTEERQGIMLICVASLNWKIAGARLGKEASAGAHTLVRPVLPLFRCVKTPKTDILCFT